MPVPIPVPLRANSNMRLEAKYNVITEFPSFDLHSAAATGNMGLVEYALARGQPINGVLDGVLPLHAACAGGNEEVVKLLIEHGADVNAPRLPRRYSNEKNRDASAPIVGTSGSTPLHFAAANGNTNIVTALLLKGAHPDRADKHGVTPEQLALQHGWLESAQVLRTWKDDKDRDLRERELLVDDSPQSGRSRQGSVGTDPESGRKRLKVKRSVDTALNMLKASSSALSDAYVKPNLSNSNLPTSSLTPPASPTWTPGDGFREGDRASSSLAPEGRRPSLPFLPPPSSPRKTLTKPPSSPRPARRPRSAGTGAEEDPDSTSPKGAPRKLGTKYSLMNIFKKTEGSNPLERTLSNTSSVASISSVSIAPAPSNTLLPSPPAPLSSSPLPSDSLGPPASGSAFSLASGLRHRMGSDAAYTSPPSAVDLHNAMAQQQQARRDRSGSSSSRFESIGLGLSFDGSGSLPDSCPARTSSQRGHVRHRSGSAHRNGAVFDDDVVVVPQERSGSSQSISTRPSILRSHNRSSSSGQGNGTPSALRALRFDSTSSDNAVIRAGDSPSLRGSNSTNSLVRFADKLDRSRSGSPATASSDNNAPQPPESAPPTVTDFQPKTKVAAVGGPEEDDEEDDEYYGLAYEHGTKRQAAQPGRKRGPSVSSVASDSSLSPSNFPFSIHSPPPVPSEDVAPRTSQEGRDRGDSVSSSSTNISASTSASAGSVTATPPELSPGSSFRDMSAQSPKVYVGEVGDQSLPKEYTEIDMASRKGRTPVDLHVDLVSCHAQAEARVQRAQQDILQMAAGDGEQAPSQTSLSARLAAYGESLAKLRELQRQADELADLPDGGDESAPVTAKELGDYPETKLCNRQRSMEERLVSRPSKAKPPKRPHTSSGTSSSCESIVTPSSLETSRPNHHQVSRSASAMEAFNNAQSRLPAGSLYKRAAPSKIPNDQLSRVSSLDGPETDTELGPPLFRVSTAPNSSANVKGRREQARMASSNNKLTRMGFSRNVAIDALPRSPPSTKRFGGLKSLMQTFKGRPTYD